MTVVTPHLYFSSNYFVACLLCTAFFCVCLSFSGGEFPKRDVKVLAISCDPLESHQGWIGDIKAHTGHEVNFPIIADADRT